MEIYRVNGQNGERPSKPGTLGMLITEYRRSTSFQKELAPRTCSDYQRCFDYLQAIEDTPLDRFTPPLIAKIRDKALEKHKFRFANYVRSVLSVIFDWGIEYGYTKDNPASKVSPPGDPKLFLTPTGHGRTLNAKLFWRCCRHIWNYRSH